MSEQSMPMHERYRQLRGLVNFLDDLLADMPRGDRRFDTIVRYMVALQEEMSDMLDRYPFLVHMHT